MDYEPKYLWRCFDAFLPMVTAQVFEDSFQGKDHAREAFQNLIINIRNAFINMQAFEKS